MDNPTELFENIKFKNILSKNLHNNYQIRNSYTSLDNINLIKNNSEEINSFNTDRELSRNYNLPLKKDRSNSILSNIKNININYNIENMNLKNQISRNIILPKSPSKVGNSGKNIINIIPRKSELKTRRSTIRKKSIYFKSTLERLYEKISKRSNNTLRFNNQIKKYMISKNYSFEEKNDINQINLSNNIDEIRKKICKSKIIKDDIYLRRISGNSKEKINNLNESDLSLKKNIKKIEENMIKLLSNLNTPINLKA